MRSFLALLMVGLSAGLSLPAAALPHAAVERAVRTKLARGAGLDLSLGPGRAMELPAALRESGVVSDVQVHEVTPLRDGKPVTGFAKLFDGHHQVAVASAGADGAEILADRKGTQAPNISEYPELRYDLHTVNQSKLARGSMIAGAVSYAALGATALLAPHLLVALTTVNLIEGIGTKAAYGGAILQIRPVVRAQRDAVKEVASFARDEQAAGRPVPFSSLYDRFAAKVANDPRVSEKQRLDAFQFRDWLNQALLASP